MNQLIGLIVVALIVIILFTAWRFNVLELWQAVLFALIAIVAAMVIVLILSQVSAFMPS